MAEPAIRALAQSSCFVCGPENPRGLQLDFTRGEAGEMSASWTPHSDHEGFHGVIHGGIVSTILDEAMAKAVIAMEIEALTAELRVRFRRLVATGQPVRVKGWISSRNKRMIHTEAALTAPDGSELAHAWAVFLELKPDP